MVSVIIKGMAMPESCSDCDFCHGHICKRTHADIITNPKQDCPLQSQDISLRKKLDEILKKLDEEADMAYSDFESYADDFGFDSEYDDMFHVGIRRAIQILKEGIEHE